VYPGDTGSIRGGPAKHFRKSRRGPAKITEILRLALHCIDAARRAGSSEG
jgi:hypothetical protein